jgi:hypothetical protein
MQTAAPATPGSTYRIEHADSKLSIRLHCEPAPIGNGLRIVPQLSQAHRASRFITRDAAELVAATYLPHTPVEIVRVDA